MHTPIYWHTQKIGTFSKIDKNVISHPNRAQHTLPAVGTVHVSHAQLAVRLTCIGGAAGPVYKMASQNGKAFSVFRFCAVQICDTVHREFLARIIKDAPRKNNA
jgi:hypothetical protein